MTTQNSQLVFDIGDPGKVGCYLGPDGKIPASIGSVVRFDGLDQNFRLVTRSADPTRQWDEVSTASATIEIGVGQPDQPPTAGTFALSYNGDTTGLTALSYNITASALQTAINANPAVISDASSSNAVQVQQFGSQYAIIWNITGARFTFVSDPTNLVPDCVATVGVIRAGGSGQASLQTIALAQKLFGYTNSFTSSASGAVTVTSLQTGSSGVKSVQRIAWNCSPYGGTYTVNLGLPQITDVTIRANTSNLLDGLYWILEDNAGSVGIFYTSSSATPPAGVANRYIVIAITSGDSAATVLSATSTAIAADPYGWTCTNPSGSILEITDPFSGFRSQIGSGTIGFAIVSKQQGTTFSNTFDWNAVAADLQRAFAGYFNVKSSNLGFTLTAVTDGAKSLVSVDVTDLLFPTFYAGSVNLNTYATLLAFAGSTEESIPAVYEMKLTYSGGQPKTFYREDIQVFRNVINVSTLIPSPITVFLVAANNLSDVASASTARTNIGAQAHATVLDVLAANTGSAALGGVSFFVGQLYDSGSNVVVDNGNNLHINGLLYDADGGVSGTQGQALMIDASGFSLWTLPTRQGTSGAMTAGSVTVPDTGCTANSIYTFATNTLGTITVASAYRVSSRIPGTSFTITSSSALDTSTVDWIATEKI